MKLLESMAVVELAVALLYNEWVEYDSEPWHIVSIARPDNPEYNIPELVNAIGVILSPIASNHNAIMEKRFVMLYHFGGGLKANHPARHPTDKLISEL